MTAHIRSNVVKVAATVAAVGVAILSLLSLVGNKDTLHILGIQSDKGAALASSACTVPHERDSEVYFVSCAGFF